MKVIYSFSMSRVHHHFEKGDFAIISAYVDKVTEEENKTRAKAMKKAVRSLGYGFVEIKGYWENEETGASYEEYPLFIPEISLEDAVSLGQGEYYDQDLRAQDSIVYADDEGIYLLSIKGGVDVDMEFDRMEANELKAAWKFWSSHRGKKWRYGSVTWSMTEPPSSSPQSWSEAARKHYWDDRAPHHHPDRNPLTRRLRRS